MFTRAATIFGVISQKKRSKGAVMSVPRKTSIAQLGKPESGPAASARLNALSWAPETALEIREESAIFTTSLAIRMDARRPAGSARSFRIFRWGVLNFSRIVLSWIFDNEKSATSEPFKNPEIAIKMRTNKVDSGST